MSNQWKLVPVEPTETMVINGFESEPNECFSDEEVWEQYQGMSGCQQAAFRAKLCWAAMLGSAPASPEPPKQPAAWLDPNSIQRGEILSARAKKNSDFLGQQDRAARFSVPLYAHTDAGEVARLTAERDALQQHLTAADERVDLLEGLLLQTNELLYAIQGDPGEVPSSSIDAMRGKVFTALKPPCSGDEHDPTKDLSCYFGLTYASWLTLPRVLMEAMPEYWKRSMATLLNQYDDAYPNQPSYGTTVRITIDGKMVRTPEWLINYRHPDRAMINQVRGLSG